MSERQNFEALLRCAVEAARAAGGHALDHWEQAHDVVERNAHDVKLRLDSECQERAQTVIQESFPGDCILAEEPTSLSHQNRRDQEEKRLWIVDPIDGTVNYSHSMPFWCCSIAVQVSSRTVAGAVYAPAFDEMYTAMLNGPALRNGVPIHVSRVRKLEDAIVLTGMDKDASKEKAPYEIFERIAARAQKGRIMGAAALDLCYVACGRADGYFETGIYDWDVTAGGFIVQQAGGKADILRRTGGGRLHYLAATSSLYDELKELVSTR